MNKKRAWIYLIIITILIITSLNLIIAIDIDLNKEYASQLIGPEVSTHKSNPGVASDKPAEIIFNVANNDFNFMIEGNLRCNPPDGVTVKSVIGASSGVGASYGTFTDILPQAQTDITFTVNSDEVFERKLMNCDLIYFYSTKMEGKKYYLGYEKKFSENKEELKPLRNSVSSALKFNSKPKEKTDKVKLALYILGSIGAAFTGIRSFFSWGDWVEMYQQGSGVFKYFRKKHWMRKFRK